MSSVYALIVLLKYLNECELAVFILFFIFYIAITLAINKLIMPRVCYIFYPFCLCIMVYYNNKTITTSDV